MLQLPMSSRYVESFSYYASFNDTIYSMTSLPVMKLHKYASYLIRGSPFVSESPSIITYLFAVVLIVLIMFYRVVNYRLYNLLERLFWACIIILARPQWADAVPEITRALHESFNHCSLTQQSSSVIDEVY